MKILIEQPPIIDSLIAVFGGVSNSAVYTYGETIYNPNNLDLREDIIVHERVHMMQQKHDDKEAALWWGKFLREPAFRLDQEARAYGIQYRFLHDRQKDRNQRTKILYSLASILSGSLYGQIVNHQEAKNLILKYANL